MRDAATPGLAEVRLRIPAREPVTLIGSAVDDLVIGAIAETEHYESNVMLALHELLAATPDAVCIDGGANIGALSLAMSLYAPEGQIHAFEPSRASRAHLHANLAGNDATNVHVWPVGLWSETATLHLHAEPSHPAGAYIGVHGAAYTSAEPIACTTLDDWVADNDIRRVDLIKLDVEGAEPRAMRGARRTIDRFRPTLLVELNPLSLHRADDRESAEHVFLELRRRFPRVLHVTTRGRMRPVLGVTHLRRLLHRRGMIDLVATDVLPPSARGIRARRLAPLKELATLLLADNRLRGPRESFMHTPSYTASSPVTTLELRANERTTVPIAVRNTSRTWWRSDSMHHPIVASYHWADACLRVTCRDGERTRLRRPLGPGRTARIDLEVLAPATPGRYTLLFTMVQEAFAWSDEIDPTLAHPIPTVVR